MALDEKKRKRMVLGLLIGAIIFGLIMKPWESSRKRGSDISPADTGQTPTTAVTNEVRLPDSEKTGQTVVFASTWPADPFLQPDVEVASPEPAWDNQSSIWKLQGIMMINGEQTCVINGQMYSVGSAIDGWKISDIGSTEVHLEKGSRNIRLELP